MEKVYEVKFMQYTNCMNDTVSDRTEDSDIREIKYLHIGKEPFLIKESELSKYAKFGGGFRNIKFVGNIKL